jgi:phage gp36-like protein
VPYATIDDVFGRYKPINTMVGIGSYDVTSVQVSSIFVADAESFVDAYLGARYEVPLAVVPSVITQITSDLAIFNMVVEKQPNVPDHMQARYDRSVTMLERFRDGDMVLTGSVTTVSTGDQEVWSSNEEFHSTFSPVLDPIDQAVDKDWVERAKDERTDDL